LGDFGDKPMPSLRNQALPANLPCGGALHYTFWWKHAPIP
jgi:hypothetical protein